MTDSAPMPAFDDLLRHEHFVRKTLRGLLRDDARIDDVVQETWLRALRRRPTAHAEPKLWLARIARNLALSGWRSERRQQRRERAVDRCLVAESAETSQRRVEMRQRVVTVILALDEPYRSVVLLRYEQELEITAIARQLGRSAATVRSQLSRAHELLRQRLDRDFGGREHWGLLAAPLAFGKTGTAPASVALVLLGSLTVVVLGFFGWRTFAPTDRPATASSSASFLAARPHTQAPLPGSEQPATLPPIERSSALPQDPQPQRGGEPALTQATLRDRRYYDDYEAATFSFEWGIRDDPDLALAHNDWELLFDGGNFLVNTVVDDRSMIADLGALEPRNFGAWRAPALAFAEQLPVEAGHAYFISTRDDDTELATIVFVRAHEPGDTCSFDWYTTDGTDRAQGSLTDPGNGRPWTTMLAELRSRQLAGRSLASPRVLLQLRGGAGGGNPRTVNLAGEPSGYIQEHVREPLDVVSPTTTDEPSKAYGEGGMIPADRDFVVTRIEYRGGNPGDNSGPGAFRVTLDGQKVIDIAPSPEPIQNVWLGRVVLAPGSEARTMFEIASSSWGEVLLTGEFVENRTRRGFGGTNRGFFAKVAPKAAVTPWALGVPSARLQVKTASVGGNPSRIDLRGKKSIYVRTVTAAPLDFAGKLPQEEQSVAYCQGGTILPGMVFVVTRVTWTGSAVGDSNGPGGIRLVVAGEKLVDLETTPDAIDGEWTGRLEVVPGEESRTYLELANSSTGDVVLTGHFENK